MTRLASVCPRGEERGSFGRGGGGGGGLGEKQRGQISSPVPGLLSP